MYNIIIVAQPREKMYRCILKKVGSNRDASLYTLLKGNYNKVSGCKGTFCCGKGRKYSDAVVMGGAIKVPPLN